MRVAGPIVVRDRFAPLRAELITLLAGLGESDWARPAVGRWSVKDVAAHLVGGDIGILSRERDAFRPSQAVLSTHRDLVALVNRLNEEWVVAARRISPRLLIELLALLGPTAEEYFSSLDLDAIGGPVSWAGPDPAPVWFDVAREYTERWHHQQQIRDATGRPALYDPYYFAPVLDTFVRALPHSFRGTLAPVGTVIRIEITGDAGGVWLLHRLEPAWGLGVDDASAKPVAHVSLAQNTAWRLFTKGIDPLEARTRVTVQGQMEIVAPIFTTTAIIG